MAGKIVKVMTNTVTSAVSTVSLTGINSDHVYMIAYNNLTPATDNRSISLRVTKSGSADTTSNYDYAYKVLNSSSSFGNGSFQNDTEFQYPIGDAIGTGTSESANGIIYLYNFNSSSKNSLITYEVTQLNNTPNARGAQGAGVHTVQSSSDGVIFFDTAGGNIASGSMTLYKIL